jgi:preprotein translocase subunit SecD
VAPPSRSAPRPWRALAGLAVIILVMLFSILGKETFTPANWHQQFKVGLGLDLSSGTQVVLQAATQKDGKPPTAGAMQQAITVLESRVNGTGNSGAKVQQVGNDLINVSVPGKGSQEVIGLVSTTAQLRFRAVLLEQPLQTAPVTPTPTTSPSSAASPSASTSPSATPTTSPSASTSAKAAGSGTAKAKTAAYIVHNAATPTPTASPGGTATPKSGATPSSGATPTTSASATPTPTVSPSAAASPTPTVTYGNSAKVNAATMKLFNKLKCTPGKNGTTVDDSWKKSVGYTDSQAQYDQDTQIVSCDASGTKYVLDKPVFKGEQITNVNTGIQQNTTEWVVNLTLNPAAGSAFGKLTTDQYNSYFSGAQTGNQDDAVLDSTAVVLDGNVQSAPQTQQPITAGQVQINGGATGFTQDQATQLSNVLKFGALPVSFRQQSVSSISATTGRDSLHAGLIAGILGLILVVFYLFFYYRGLGIVSVCSLLIAALLSYLAVVLLSRYQSYTMELAGIAGLIVAIGITADSFIVFFERLRDEVRDGKTLRPAVESGWKRARRTILVSDTVSFLAAVLLYKFAVSDVQGFAYTLGLTTLIDVLVVFLFTKPMVTLLAGTEFFGGGHKWSGLDPERLGAKTLWRSSTRRTIRTQRSASAARASAPANASNTKEA